MRIGVFKNPELREWLQSAGMKEYVYRPFVVDDMEVARLETEARVQHPNEGPGMIRARGVGRALALKLSREKRSKDTAEQAEIFKPPSWDWDRIFNWGFRVLVVVILLLIFLLGTPLRGEAQRRSLRVQWKDEGVILGTRGGGNLWIIDCTGAGLTCTISGATITIDGSAGGGGYATIQEEGSALTQRTIFNFIGAGVTAVDNPGATRTDITIPGGAGNSFGTIGAAIADSGADTLTVTDSPTIDFTTTDDPEDLTAIIIAESITAVHIDETVAYALSNVGNTFIGASYTSSAADPADAGVLRAGNAEDWVCVESAPTGAEICAQLDASENWQFDNDLAWLSGTAFQGVLAHANTALRTYTFGDRNMTVAAVVGTPVTGNCAEFDANDDVVDSGGVCGGSDGVGYDEVLEEASGLTKRAQINFIGVDVTAVDNGGATRTDVTIIPVAEVYDAAGWNADTGAASKDNIRDKIESLVCSDLSDASATCATEGANTALSNLASVALNLPLLPDVAAADDFGSATLPFKDLFLAGSSGTPATNNFRITGTSTSGTRVFTLADAASNSVVPDTGAANNFLTAIASTGAISKAQPAFTNLSGTASAAQIQEVIALADLTDVASTTGSGTVSVLGTNPTLTDVTIDDLLTFTETAGDDTCGAGDYWIKGNSTATTLRGCEDGSLFTLSAGGGDGVGYDEILDEASGLTKRAQLNFIGGGVSCVDNAGATRTDCTIAGGGGGGAQVRTVRIPINYRNPRVSSLFSNWFFITTGLTDWDAGHWEAVQDVDGKAYGVVNIPTNVAATPNAKIVFSIAANATSGVTRQNVATAAVADGESLNPAALVNETAQDVTVPATARLRKDVTFTLTNPPAADDILIVEIFHEGTQVNDTLAVNTEYYDFWLEIDVNSGGTHDILSSTHSDTTAAAILRGDLLTGQLATPKLQRLALGGTNLYPKSDGTDIVYSTLAAGGVGSCTSQFVRALNADAAPTCATVSSTDTSGTFPPDTEALAFIDLSDIASTSGSGTVGLFGTGPTITTFLTQDGDAAEGGYLRLQNLAAIQWEAAPAGTDEPSLTVDAVEALHFSFLLDGGAARYIVENTFVNVAASTDETAELDFVFGGITATRIQAIKEVDFTPAADEDSALTFFTRLDGSLTERARLNSAGEFDVDTGFTIAGAATTGRYLRGDGTRFAQSSGAASGTGACTNQFARVLNDDAAPTCATVATTDIALGAADDTIIRDSAGFSVIGKTATGTGDPADIVAAGDTVLGRTGAGNLVFAQVATGQIANSAVTSLKLATVNKTFEKSITIIDPTTTEDDKVQWLYGKAVTFTSVNCSTDTGTVTIDMDHRVLTTPNTVGTDILTGTIVCDTDNQADGGFADATIPANVPVNLSITAVASTPGAVRIHITYTVDP